MKSRRTTHEAAFTWIGKKLDSNFLRLNKSTQPPVAAMAGNQPVAAK
jgi:hypothetical protein